MRPSPTPRPSSAAWRAASVLSKFATRRAGSLPPKRWNQSRQRSDGCGSPSSGQSLRSSWLASPIRATSSGAATGAIHSPNRRSQCSPSHWPRP